MILNENGAISLDSTGNARVDLFFKLTQDAYKNQDFYKLISY